MSKWTFLLLLCTSLFGLELSVQSGKEQGNDFSTIHLKDSKPFYCEAHRDDFEEIKEIICAFEQRPDRLFKPLNNNFFTVTAQTRDKNYFLIITPHAKMKLFPIVFDLSSESTLYKAGVKRSGHWMILGYRDVPPFIKENPLPPLGINFPVEDIRPPAPYVGGLDIKGNPIHMTQVKDVSEYIAIKRFYRAKSYPETLELVEHVLENYPDSVFKNELVLYKIRCLHHLRRFEELLSASKHFLRTYSSDESVPEVLAYTADAYAQLNQFSDSDYFFDRLFTEYEEDYFTNLGLIFKGDQLSSAGNAKKAFGFYEKAMYEAKDVDLASMAAFKLVVYFNEQGESKKAAEYVEKIWQGNGGYFYENLPISLEMAAIFADRGYFVPASRIVGSILEKMTKDHPRYEFVLKDTALWLAGAEEKDKAFATMERYMTEYPYGDFTDVVKRARDALFFEGDDQNMSERLAEYDSLITKYSGDVIGEKALYKKAQLLYDNGYLQSVLDMNGSLALLDAALYPDAQNLVKDAAIGLMKRSLDEDKCSDVIALSQRYDITLSKEWDEGIHACAVQVGNYALAKSLARPYLKSPDIAQRMKWLQRYIRADFATGNYSEAARAAKDLLAMGEMEKSTAYDSASRVLFDALQRLGDEEGMIEAIATVETKFGRDFEDVDRYTQMVALAQKRKDDQMVENFASKVMQLQEKKQSYTQTPYIEFTLMQSLLNLNKEQKAITVLQSLDKRKLTAAKRSRQQYLLAMLLQKAGRKEEAKKAYEKSIESDAQSAWAKLAADALKLL